MSTPTWREKGERGHRLTHLPSLSKGGLKRLPLAIFCRKLKVAEVASYLSPASGALLDGEPPLPVPDLEFSASPGGKSTVVIEAEPTHHSGGGARAFQALELLQWAPCSSCYPDMRQGATRPPGRRRQKRVRGQDSFEMMANFLCPLNPQTDDTGVEHPHGNHPSQPLSFQVSKLNPGRGDAVQWVASPCPGPRLPSRPSPDRTVGTPWAPT